MLWIFKKLSEITQFPLKSQARSVIFYLILEVVLEFFGLRMNLSISIFDQ